MTTDDEPDVDPRVAEAVMSYFRHHPRAADSLEGIARWRLLEERALLQVEETARALRWLVARGQLVEESHPGMTALFRLAPSDAPPRRRQKREERR